MTSESRRLRLTTDGRRFPGLWLLATAALAAAAFGLLAAGAAGGQTAAARAASPAHAAPLALTPAEYNNTIADLFGFPRDGDRWPARPALADRISPRREPSKGVFTPPPPPPVWPWRFPSEAGSDGFEGIAEGQAPSSYQVEELHLAAMHFASFAIESPTFFACDGWASRPAAEQAACAWAGLERFARRAYRRPLDAGETRRLEQFWQANAAAGPLDEAVALTVAGILQSPTFHFRIEPRRPADIGADKPPSRWELASRLSYFLWDSMPDEALFAAAASGELDTRAGVEAQARRMLDDPKARPALVRFHHQWLGTGDVLLVAPARRAFGPLFGIEAELATARDDDVEWPAIMGPMRHSMKIETELFVERTVFDGAGTFTALMTDHHGYLSDATAPIYGEGAKRVEGPEVTRTIDLVVASIGRRKPLTLYPASFPARGAGGGADPAVGPRPRRLRGAAGAHPARRAGAGTACLHAPGHAGPGGGDGAAPRHPRRRRAPTASAPRPPPAPGRATRVTGPSTRRGSRSSTTTPIGRWRSHDNGQPVDASGSLALAGGERITFADGVDFARQLAASGRVRDCYVLCWTRYALGERLDAAAPGLDALQAGFRADDSIRTLLVSIAGSDLFRRRPSAGPAGRPRMISRRHVLQMGGTDRPRRRGSRCRAAGVRPRRGAGRGASSSSATATAGPTRTGGCAIPAGPRTSPGPSTSAPLAARAT